MSVNRRVTVDVRGRAGSSVPIPASLRGAGRAKLGVDDTKRTDRALRGIEGVQTVVPEGEGAWRVVADRDVRAVAAQRIVSSGGSLTRLADLQPSLEEVYTRYFQEARHAA
jgi:ABC-2 type transport system ATP-binding protein